MEILGVPCGQFFNVRDLAISETLDFILTSLMTNNDAEYITARAIWGPDWNCQRDPSCETWQWLWAHLPTFCQVLNPQSIRMSETYHSSTDLMSTEQRESPSTSGLWYEFKSRFCAAMTTHCNALQSRCPSPVPTFFEDANLLLYSPMSQEDIRWNWEKVIPTKFPISAKQDCYIQWWCEWCLQQAQTKLVL